MKNKMSKNIMIILVIIFIFPYIFSNFSYAATNYTLVQNTTDTEKAYAVTEWVIRNIAYGGDVIGVKANAQEIYHIFEQKAGHCEGFTMLTNYMLYLCEIPTAIVRNTGHEWTAAFVDGEWIYIDTTHNRFDSTDSNAYDILFLYNGGIYELSEPQKV